MKLLVLNSGSSSLKYQLFEFPQAKTVASGLIERIGEIEGRIIHKIPSKGKEIKRSVSITNHKEALYLVAEFIVSKDADLLKHKGELVAIGHRVVHGGESFSAPQLISSNEIIKKLKALSFLAPLHNPANIEGIEVALEVFPNAQQVAVFDTAFHQSLPEHVYRYALPNYLYTKYGLRAYGFHGTSHQYVSRTAAEFLGQKLDSFNCISIHLGNGCSITAVKGGKSIDHSMGLTPLSGLVMGSRPGDFDPSLILFLAKNLQMDMAEIDHLLNKQSGLVGLTGENDLREILARCEKGEPESLLAIEMYVYRIRKYIGAYAVALGRVDALIFTAGVGENSSIIRSKVCSNLEILGIAIDESLNEKKSAINRMIQSHTSKIKVLVIPTNEELEIAIQSKKMLDSRSN